jgi:hypothetical protein
MSEALLVSYEIDHMNQNIYWEDKTQVCTEISLEDLKVLYNAAKRKNIDVGVVVADIIENIVKISREGDGNVDVEYWKSYFYGDE